MLEIGEAYVRASIAAFSAEDRRRLGRRLQEDVEIAARQLIRFEELELEIRVEDGSVRIKATAKVAITLLLFYGSVRTGVEYAARDGRQFAQWVVERIHEVLPGGVRIDRFERRTRDAGRLKRLFDRVATGDISVEEAYAEAIRILERAADEPDDIGAVAPHIKRGLEDIEPASILPTHVSLEIPLRDSDTSDERHHPRGIVWRKRLAADEWDEEEY